MYVEASSPFEAVLESGQPGLVGSIEVKVIDNDGATVIGPTTLNIAEDGVSGIYLWNAPAAPGPLGQYTIVWSLDGSFDDDTVAVEDLIVVEQTAGVLPPIPAPDDGGYAIGPCTAWTTAEEVAECCSVTVGTDTFLFDSAVETASQVLYENSGKQFKGLCSRTVRPCSPVCGCGWQVLARGYVIWHGDSWICNGESVGCCGTSDIDLPGAPVRTITEVKIDGVAIDPTGYRLVRRSLLRRTNGEVWPGCQNLEDADTEEGTFSVSYTYGSAIPSAGRDAAKQLACEIYKSCPGNEGVGDCAIPKNATRVTKQGITIELGALRFDRRQGWKTGMKLVDLFLNTYNPYGKRRAPAVWSPDAMLPEPV